MPVNERAPLTRDRVLQAALHLADTEGLPALTMRRLGAALGVEAMALYHHVASKADLMAGLADQVAVEVDEPPAGAGWREQLRQRAVTTHAALLRHPWAATLWVGQASGVGPERMRLMEGTLSALRAAGFPPTLLDRAFHTLQNHVLGHAVQAVTVGAGSDAEGGDLAGAAARFLTRPELEDYPELAAHVRWHVATPHTESAFAFGLDLLLDGLERALAAEAGRPEPEGPPPVVQDRSR
ncbi:TetR/AcrR family transcriptional regulator [Jannaschia sp. R86511]|uniref:TetR/AcrR family transcriptional regulator n=1 Tax=Jannaschia sp. R86511 TaxID=3093853 RepID=UPI0036D2E893